MYIDEFKGILQPQNENYEHNTVCHKYNFA